MTSGTRLRLEGNKWVEDSNSDFWLPDKIIENLDRVKYIQERDFDAVILIDGMERVGKSVLAMNCARYLSNDSFDLRNYARGLKDCAKKIASLPDKSVVILDETSLIFNRKSATAKPVKALLALMDVVGQKNLIFILCLPSFFDLPPQMAIRRSKFLLRVDVGENYSRAKVMFWGEKAKEWLYKKGRKKDDSYGVVPYGWVVDFKNPWYPSWYTEYKEGIKKDSLKEALRKAIEAEEGSKQSQASKLKKGIYLAIIALEKEGYTHYEIADKLSITRELVSQWKKRYDNEGDDTEIDFSDM